MNKYTVLLLYPDYLSDCPETYLAYVEAAEINQTAQFAQIQALRAQTETIEMAAGDFLVLAIFDGHLQGLWEEK